MPGLRFEALPYDEEGTIRFTLDAAGGGFRGMAELYQRASDVKQLGERLAEFPRHIQHTVTFEYGDGVDRFPYHVVLRAQVMDSAGHAAIFVRIQSFCGSLEAGLCELFVPAEAAAINDLGRQLIHWSTDSAVPIDWQPKASA